MGRKSEGSQAIYRMHKPLKKTEFGDRVMTEIGRISGLEIEDTANYVLIPYKKDNEDTTSWSIHRIKHECDVEVVSYDNLDEDVDESE